MNMAQQTAVEWMIQWSKENPIAYQSDYHAAIEQAKEMEKNQIMEAYHDGVKSILEKNINTMQNYYNQTFGK